MKTYLFWYQDVPLDASDSMTDSTLEGACHVMRPDWGIGAVDDTIDRLMHNLPSLT